MSPRWHNKSRAATSAFEMFFWDWKVRFLEGVFLPYVSTSLEMEWRRQKSLQNCRWMKVECRAQSELGMWQEGEKWSRLTLYCYIVWKTPNYCLGTNHLCVNFGLEFQGLLIDPSLPHSPYLIACPPPLPPGQSSPEEQGILQWIR